MNKRITFVLPGHGKNPIGGYKVAYEYANHLSARGHEVNIIHPTRLYETEGLYANITKYGRYLERKLDGSYSPRQWFELDKNVNCLWVPSLEKIHIPDSDAVIATLWKTAEWVAGYGPEKGRKLYLIQHFEDWSGPRDQVLTTWSLPLHKIVISRWLARIAEGIDEKYTYIPNGLDFSRFGMDTPFEGRNPLRIMMLYHDEAWKGSRDGLEALRIVKDRFPDLSVSLFGVPSGKQLPTWVEYHRTPPQHELRKLYNQASIFLAPSWAEGWPLPPAEAMMCGAAVVATDIGGHQEYAYHGDTALLAPPRQPEALADRIMALIEDPGKRIAIARAGMNNIQKFTWNRACDKLEQLILQDD